MIIQYTCVVANLGVQSWTILLRNLDVHSERSSKLPDVDLAETGMGQKDSKGMNGCLAKRMFYNVLLMLTGARHPLINDLLVLIMWYYYCKKDVL